MTYHGKVRGGRIVIPKSGLRDGTLVTVELAKPRTRAVTRQRKPGIMKYAGVAKGLPSDASRNLDHYLYGHPKR